MIFANLFYKLLRPKLVLLAKNHKVTSQMLYINNVLCVFILEIIRFFPGILPLRLCFVDFADPRSRKLGLFNTLFRGALPSFVVR